MIAGRRDLSMEPSQDPIEFILEEHDRQLEVCALLEDLLATPDSQLQPQSALPLLEYLTKDLPTHIEDEEQDLFPLLASRQVGDPNLPVILDQLVLEHELDLGLVEPIVDDLRNIAEGRTSADARRFYANVRTFTQATRRHLNWENRVVLPLAQRVLGEEDRSHLASRMAARRQHPLTGGG
jgi:hemerythrin-like domain-containing protein